MTLSRVVGSPFTQETSDLPSWTFFSWVTSFTIRAFILVFFMVVSYFSTKLACTSFFSYPFHKASTSGTQDETLQSQLKFFPSGYSLPSIDGLVHPPPSSSTCFKAPKSMLGHILSGYSVYSSSHPPSSESIGPSPIDLSVQKI